MTGLYNPDLTTTNTSVTPQDYSTAVYGKIIPLSTGDRKISGVPIWCGVISKENQATLLPAGPITAQTGQLANLTAKASFAVAFGYCLAPPDEREFVSVAQLWANDVLVYDASDPAQITKYPDVRFSVYGAGVAQLPDATIVADKGDLTPGFENLIYIVFYDFPIGKFGGGVIPTIKARLVDALEIENTHTPFTLIDTGAPTSPDGTFVNLETGRFFAWSGIATSSPVLHEFSMAPPYEGVDLLEVKRTTITGLGSELLKPENMILFDPDTRTIVVPGGVSISNTVPYKAIDVDSGAVTASYGTESSDTDSDDGGSGEGSPGIVFPKFGGMVTCKEGGVVMKAACIATLLSNELCLLQFGNVGDSPPTELRFDEDHQKHTFADAITAICTYPILGRTDISASDFRESGQDAVVFVATGDTLRQQIISVQAGVMTFRNDYGTGTVAGFPVWRTFPDFDIRNIFVDHASGDLILLLQNQSVSSTWKVARIGVTMDSRHQGSSDSVDNAWLLFRGPGPTPTTSELDGPDIVAKTQYEVTLPTGASTARNFISALSMSRTDDGRIIYPSSGGDVVMVDLNSGSATVIDEPNGWFDSGEDWYWDGRDQKAVVTDPPAVVHLNLITSSGTTLDKVLLWLALAAGYSESDIEIDPLLTDAVQGVQMEEEFASSALWLNLGRVYDFQTYESEGKIKFVRQPRGDENASAELTVSDLVPLTSDSEYGNESLISKISSPQDTPDTQGLNYIDPANDYTYSIQTASNATSVDPSATSDVVTTIKVPIVMSSQEAFERVSRLLTDLQQMSSTQQFRLPWRFMELEPTDVVTVSVNDFTYTVLLTQITYNGDWTLSIEARNYGFNGTVAVQSDGVLGHVPQTIPAASDSKAFVFDIPLLRYSDEIALSSVVYTAVASYGQPQWQGATMYRSIGSQTYVPQYHSSDKLIYGIVSNALPADDQPWHTDEATILTVVLRGSATSDIFDSTDADGLNDGLNALLVGQNGRWEFIYFRDVNVVNAKVVELTGLRRGRRGTDVNCSNHQPGDAAVLVRSVVPEFQNVMVEQVFTTEIGETAQYKALGDIFYNSPQVVSITLEGNSLKPWAPHDYGAVASSNDVILTWARRTRLNGPLVDGTGDVPLDEAEELYDLEILSGSDVIRTVAGLTAATFTYTDAMQTADGFTAPVASITIRVYQISAVVGRGFTFERTIDVE